MTDKKMFLWYIPYVFFAVIAIGYIVFSLNIFVPIVGDVIKESFPFNLREDFGEMCMGEGWTYEDDTCIIGDKASAQYLLSIICQKHDIEVIVYHNTSNLDLDIPDKYRCIVLRGDMENDK